MLFIRMWIPPGASVFAHVLHMKINYRHIFSLAGLYIFFYLLVTVSFAMITVPYNALIADKSHYSQRGITQLITYHYNEQYDES